MEYCKKHECLKHHGICYFCDKEKKQIEEFFNLFAMIYKKFRLHSFLDLDKEIVMQLITIDDDGKFDRDFGNKSSSKNKKYYDKLHKLCENFIISWNYHNIVENRSLAVPSLVVGSYKLLKSLLGGSNLAVYPLPINKWHLFTSWDFLKTRNDYYNCFGKIFY
jgi:hypothetical protein